MLTIMNTGATIKPRYSVNAKKSPIVILPAKIKQRPPDILKEAEGSGFKYGGLAFFRVKAFDHAHTSKRFRQASGDLGVDLSALTENRANRFECLAKNQAEDQKKAERQKCECRIDPDEKSKRNDSGEQPADEVDESGSNEIANSFYIRHDSRNQGSGLVRVVISDGQPSDMLLYFDPHLGDQPLCRRAQQANQRVGGQGLNQDSPGNSRRDRNQQILAVFLDDIVDKKFGRPGKNQARGAVDKGQYQAQQKQVPPRPDQFPQIPKDV